MRIQNKALAAVLLLLAASCGGSGSESPPPTAGLGEPTTPTPPVSKAWTMILGVPKQNIFPGDTAQWKVTVFDQSGAVLPNEPVAWSSGNTSVVSVSTGGLLTGVGVGRTSVSVTVVNKTSIAGSDIINVNARPAPPPTRPAGALLRIGGDSILQYESYLHVSTLIYADTASAGKDVKRGVIHVASAPFVAPILREDFPFIAAIAECPNGVAYAVSAADNSSSAKLWQIDPTTGYITNPRGLPLDPYTPTGITCDNTNALVIVGNFAGFGSLWRVDSQKGTFNLNSIDEAYRGVGAAGATYVTTVDQYGAKFPSNVERLATLNTATGVLTQIGAARQAGIVSELAFRGTRLFGVSGSRMVEVNTQTGVISTIRTVTLP